MVNLVLLLFTSEAKIPVKLIQTFIFSGLLLDVVCMSFGCCQRRPAISSRYFTAVAIGTGIDVLPLTIIGKRYLLPLGSQVYPIDSSSSSSTAGYNWTYLVIHACIWSVISFLLIFYI